ncbi:protein adenylyltransferase FICD-like [Planococcus citri]|uniref:protein adenylyltransferase FICD-like n=1 Tax=Planococcus citri TaxID=170843 RepID=UPI0031F842ED
MGHSRYYTIARAAFGIGLVLLSSMYSVNLWNDFKRRRRSLPEVMASIASLHKRAKKILANHPERKNLALEETFQKYAQHTLTIPQDPLPEYDRLRVEWMRSATDYVTNDFKWGQITDGQIRNVHTRLTRLENPEISGDYRTHDLVHESYGEMTVPPHHGEILRLMVEFLDWWNAQPLNFENRILIAAEAKLRLVAIYPFADANGRTSRAIFVGLLRQVPEFPFVVIPHSLRQSYFTAIKLHIKTGETEVFVKFLVTLVEESFQDFIKELCTNKLKYKIISENKLGASE